MIINFSKKKWGKYYIAFHGSKCIGISILLLKKKKNYLLF